MRSSSFTASPAKRIVREIWNTPFLEYIHSKYGVKYRYFGLPGPNIEDVRLWRNMIEEVVAFELPPLGIGERSDLVQLRANLMKLKILHVVYCGSFEDVVIRREDMEGQKYEQDKLITLYNLDFCDEISSYVATKELGQKRLRYEAIRVILLDQKTCYLRRNDNQPCYFIILLTVRNQIEAERVIEYMSRDKPLEETYSYFLSCSKKPGIPPSGSLIGTHAWAIKALLYDCLMTDFKGHNIDSLLFPILKYRGRCIVKSGEPPIESPMFHWMLLCKFGSEENPSPRVYPHEFLKKVNSLSAVGSRIGISIEPEEDRNRNQQIHPVRWFQQYESAFVSGGRLI